MATALVAVCELIMILRVYALYGRNLWVLSGLMFVWVVQVVVSSIGLTTGKPVLFDNGIIGCILSGDSKLFPVIWITPLITDFIVFVLTLYRSRDYFRHGSNIRTLQKFVRDGTVYFFVICMANLLNVLVYFLSPASDLRTLGASFSQIITSVVISRMVLNLRSETAAASPKRKFQNFGTDTTPAARFMDKAIGDLGEDAGGITTDELASQGIVITRTEVIHSDAAGHDYGFDNFAMSSFEYRGEQKRGHAV